jgi:hypothetical protein
MQPINGMVGARFRTLVQLLQANAENQGLVLDNNEVLDWSIWLFDKMDEQPPIEGPAYVLYRDWSP